MTPCRQAAGMDESSSTARTPSHWPTSSTSGEETRQSLSALCPHPWLLDAANTVHSPVLACLLGSWFMTREIELAAANISDVSCDMDKRTVTWKLPISKTDTTGQGVERTHGCAGNTNFQAPASGQQLISRRQCGEPLCPFHSMVTYLNLRGQFLRTTRPGDRDGPLFCTNNGQRTTKAQSVQAIRITTLTADLGDRRTSVPDDSIRARAERTSGHSLRVAGAQLMAPDVGPLPHPTFRPMGVHGSSGLRSASTVVYAG